MVHLYLNVCWAATTQEKVAEDVQTPRLLV